MARTPVQEYLNHGQGKTAKPSVAIVSYNISYLNIWEHELLNQEVLRDKLQWV